MRLSSLLSCAVFALSGLMIASQQRISAACCLFVILIASGAGNVYAGDWPQILGPDRDGVAHGETVRTDWKQESPSAVWKYQVGSGVAGVAVQQNLLVLFHRIDDEEIAVGLNVSSGEEIWSQKFPTTYQSRIVPDDGPLCVPVISQETVYLYGASGMLHALELKSGNVRWSRNTHEDYGADTGYFGAGSTPLIDGELVLVNVGGFRQEAGVVAFDTKTGKTVWKTGAWHPSYSAPVITQLNETPVAVFTTRYETVGLDPKTGKTYFSIPFGQRGPTVNGASPVVIGNHLLLTASYGIGNLWARISLEGAEVLREELAPVASQYTTPVPVGNTLIGIDGRQDGGPADLVSFDPVTGKEFWRESGFGYATLIKSGKVLLIQKTTGELVLVVANAQKYEELARTQLMPGTVRALPALAGGRYFLRNESVLSCFLLSE